MWLLEACPTTRLGRGQWLAARIALAAITGIRSPSSPVSSAMRRRRRCRADQDRRRPSARGASLVLGVSALMRAGLTQASPLAPVRDSDRLAVATSQMSSTTPWPPPPCRSFPRASAAPPLRSIRPSALACRRRITDIDVLPSASQINYRPLSPAHNHPLKAKVIFCVRGAIAPSLTDLVRRAPQTPGSGGKNGLFRIAVGTVIAHRPPRRPGRAQLRHPVLTSSI